MMRQSNELELVSKPNPLGRGWTEVKPRSCNHRGFVKTPAPATRPKPVLKLPLMCLHSAAWKIAAKNLVSGLLIALVSGCLLTAVVGCTSQEATARNGGGKGGRPLALVRIAKIEERDVTPTVVVVGSVVPVASSIVASGADGVVESFLVEEGDYVKTGDILSELRMVTTDLGILEAKAVLEEREQELKELEAGSRQEDKAEASAKMKAAEAIQKNTASKLVRAQSLFDRSAINRDELDNAIERAEAAWQVFLAAKATSERVNAGPRPQEIKRAAARFRAQQQQVAYLDAERNKRVTRAPFDGFVVVQHSYLGQWLSKGDPVVTLARMDAVEILANVDQRDAGLVQLFDQAGIHVGGTEREQWSGTIVAMVPRSEWKSGSRGFPVKVRLKNEIVAKEIVDDQGNKLTKMLPTLKEGMMAEVTFSGKPIEAVLAPKDAIVRTSRGTQMFLFDPLVSPKWSITAGDELLGDVLAADEKQARQRARKQFSIADDRQLSVKQTQRPRWAVRAVDAKESELKLLGYLEADSEELAREAAKKQYQLADDAQLELAPQLGSVRRVVVELGISDGDMIQVLSTEFKLGSYDVVSEGAERLQDYQSVRLPNEEPKNGKQ